MSKCKHCEKTGNHYCEVLQRNIDEEKDCSDFLLSAALGVALHGVPGGGLLGGVLGGDLWGGTVGELVGDLILEDEFDI